jgi:hypothetical protein
VYRNQFLLHREEFTSHYKVNLNVVKEIFPVCSEKHTKHMNKLCGGISENPNGKGRGTKSYHLVLNNKFRIDQHN